MPPAGTTCRNGVCPPSRHDDLDTTKRLATISTIGFVVAGVGAAVGVVGLLTTAGESERPSWGKFEAMADMA